MSRGYLILANGRVFEGERFGADTDSTGELVFTTTAGAYVETLTDTCYCGQIIMQTFPLIGNYGWIGGMEASQCFAAGYVVREWCEAPSNFRCEGDIDTYLKAQGIPGLCGVDTREITQIIREEGVMAARISSSPDADFAALSDFAVTNPVSRTAVSTSDIYPAEGECCRSVAILNFGQSCGAVPALCTLGCQVRVFPYGSSAEDIMSNPPDGIVLTDGPGDPAENSAEIELIRQLAGRIPMFGFGLGHQLMALAAGGSTEKLKFGHRGANQPVKDLASGKVLITNQNHGYTVVSGSVSGAGVTHVNLNDSTCEGLEYTDRRAFSVQFRPERTQFEQFVKLMGGNC